MLLYKMKCDFFMKDEIRCLVFDINALTKRYKFTYIIVVVGLYLNSIYENIIFSIIKKFMVIKVIKGDIYGTSTKKWFGGTK